MKTRNRICQTLLLALAIGFAGLAVAQEEEKTYTVNFEDTDIQKVIRFVADATDKTIIIDPKVRGQIKVISSKPVDSEELYELFLSILDIHGFTAVESGNVVRIVANRDARSLAVPTGLQVPAPGERTDEAGEPRAASPRVDDTYVTQVIRLEHISAAKVLPTLRPLVPQHGHLAAYDPSNALIMTDTRSNIQRIRSLIDQMDQSAVTETELVELRYARAPDVVNVINQLTQREQSDGGQSPMSIVADERINAVLIHGDEMQRERAKRLIDQLDLPRASDSNVRVIYLEYAKAERVAQVLSGVIQNLSRMRSSSMEGDVEPSVDADEDTNALLITADGDTMEALLSVVDSLDIRRAQVLVEAIIVEIDDTAGRELGINWMYRDSDYGFGSSTSGDGRLANLGMAALGESEEALSTLASGLSSTAGQLFGIGRLGERTDFLGILRMLQESSSSNILSTPSLLTTDNHTASISVGQNVPFVTGSYSSAGSGVNQPQNPFQTIERRDVGILLEVTPYVNEGDSVVLDISQEVSSVMGEGSSAGIITNQRRIETQVLAGDGETVVLGGLIKDDVQTSERRVPLLGDIPGVGNLFRTQSSETVKTNLMVFIRASIMRDDRMLEGATGEKYRIIREDQLERQRRSGILINRDNMPVIPEWQTHLEHSFSERGDPDDDGAQSDD